MKYELDFLEFERFKENRNAKEDEEEKKEVLVLKKLDPEFERVLLNGKVHLVTPANEAKKKIAEIIASLGSTPKNE
jgi:ribosomal protein L15